MWNEQNKSLAAVPVQFQSTCGIGYVVSLSCNTEQYAVYIITAKLSNRHSLFTAVPQLPSGD